MSARSLGNPFGIQIAVWRRSPRVRTKRATLGFVRLSLRDAERKGKVRHRIAAVPFAQRVRLVPDSRGITGSSSLLSEREQRRGTRKLRRNMEGAPAAKRLTHPSARHCVADWTLQAIFGG